MTSMEVGCDMINEFNTPKGLTTPQPCKPYKEVARICESLSPNCLGNRHYTQ